MKIALLSRWLWEENRRSGNQGGNTYDLAHAVQKNSSHKIITLSQSPHAESLTPSVIGDLEAWLSPRETRDWKCYLPDKGLKFFFKHRKLFSDAIALGQFLKRCGPFDLLWAQCEEPDGLVAALASKIFKLPPIVTQVYALRYGFSSEDLPMFQEKLAIKTSLKASHTVITASELVSQTLLTHYEIPKTTRVPHNLTRGFLHTPILNPPPAQLSPRILFLGALNQKKGALVFLNAIEQLEKENPLWQFSMIGGFTEKNSNFTQRWNQALSESKIKEKVRLLGSLPQHTVIEEIQKANLVVLPSLFDEFSRALIEALALGRPVVTTTQVGAAYLLERDQSGIATTPNSSSALADAIKQIISNPNFQNNAFASAQKIREEFSPKNVAQKTIEIFEKIVNVPSGLEKN